MSSVTLASIQNMRKELVKSRYYLNIRSGYMAPVTIHCSYGDSGEPVTFYIFDGGDELDLTGSVVAVHGTRRDGANFGPFTCTVSGNAVTFNLQSTMTAVEGGGIAEITITKGQTSIGTCNFGIMVEDAVFPNGVAYDSDPSIYQDILAYVQTIPASLTADYTSKIAAEVTARTNSIAEETSARIAGDNSNSSAIAVERSRIDNYLKSGTAATDSELVDIRVAGNGNTYDSAGTAVRSQYLELRNSIFSMGDMFQELNATYVRGGISSDGSINTSETHRIATQSIVSFSYPLFIKCDDSNYVFDLYFYNSSGGVRFHPTSTRIGTCYFIPANERFRVLIRKVTETAGLADIGDLRSKVLVETKFAFDMEETLSKYDELFLNSHLQKRFLMANYSSSSGAFVDGGYCALSKPVIYPFEVIVNNSSSASYFFNVKTWKSSTPSSSTYIGTSGWQKVTYTIPENTYFTIEFANQTSSVTPPAVSDVSKYLSFTTEDGFEDNIRTLNFWDEPATSYSDYLKRYMAHDMQHKYWTQGNVVNAPTYYSHVANHYLPVGATVDFSGASFKVAFYQKDGAADDSNGTGWSTAPKYIPPHSYFMISAQNSTALTLDEWFDKFNVVADYDIVQKNDFSIPVKNYASQWSAPNRFQLLWFSDIHGDRMRLKRIVDYISQNGDTLTDAICTGDLVADKLSDDYTYWSADGADNILTVIGNHDGRTTSGWATNKDMYDKFFAPYIANWGVTYTADYCNWYKVYNSSIMLIGLCAVNSTTAEEDTMMSFLNNALSVAKTNNYAVIIAHHYPSDSTYTSSYNTPFETPNYTPHDLFIPERVFAAVKTFRDGGGEFVCYITGHTHSDLARYRTSDKQILLTVSTAFITAGIQQNAQYRRIYTQHEDLFNILFVDRVAKVVSVKRIGADRDMWFRKLDYLSINYETGEMI